MFAIILAHLAAIASKLEDKTGLEHIPLVHLEDIFSGITANHNETFLDDSCS